MKNFSKILLFQIGSIGDTIVVLPIINWLHAQYPDAQIDWLCNCGGSRFCGPEELLKDSGIIHEFINYYHHEDVSALTHYAKLLWKLRQEHYDALIYLVRSIPQWKKKVFRDHLFFRLAGISFHDHYGFGKEFHFPGKKDGELPVLPTHTQIFIERIRQSGLPIELPPEQYDMDLHFKDAEIDDVSQSVGTRIPTGKIPVAMGVGGNRQVCRWPLINYVQVLKDLMAEYPLYPVFFGGKEDFNAAENILASVSCGLNLSGELRLRQTVAAMPLCRFYLGNDTGVMHLAAVAKLPCVAVFSAHNYRGLWTPFGQHNLILRPQMECENCRLQICREDPPVCLKKITVSMVSKAVRKILRDNIYEKNYF